MSFEGYYQVICKKGHYRTEDLHIDLGKWSCPVCKSKVAWWNLVDLTNGSFDGKKRIDGYVATKIIKEAKNCTCESCGNVHVIDPPVFKIPKKGHREQCK